MKTHDIKIDLQYFDDVIDCKKTFEVRKNDRNYNVGDKLNLREYNNEKKNYTGRNILASIIYILDDQEYLREGYVILAIKLLKINE